MPQKWEMADFRADLAAARGKRIEESRTDSEQLILGSRVTSSHTRTHAGQFLESNALRNIGGIGLHLLARV